MMMLNWEQHQLAPSRAINMRTATLFCSMFSNVPAAHDDDDDDVDVDVDVDVETNQAKNEDEEHHDGSPARAATVVALK